MRVVGCFLEFNGRFVILLRHSHKPEGNTWGLPGGKVEQGESDENAILRELEEETGYKAAHSALERLGDFDFVSDSNGPFTYTAFRVKLPSHHDIRLEETAHTDYQWVSAEECYAKSDLIPDLHELLRIVGYMR